MRITLFFLLIIATSVMQAQVFQLEKKTDSLYYLTLKTDSTLDKWKLPHPVYRFCTGDIDGDGNIDAMVGVINITRFYKQPGRRLFIFKNKKGRVRPLWLGSKLGGILQDFRVVDDKIRSLETTTDGHYVVAEYKWQGFGMGFERFIVFKKTILLTACIALTVGLFAQTKPKKVILPGNGRLDIEKFNKRIDLKMDL